MLLDRLQILATPAPLGHRRLRCVGNAVRIGLRARRCTRAWAPHPEATKAMVRAAIGRTERRNTGVVLHRVTGFSDWRP